MARPIAPPRARALGAVASALGTSLHFHLPRILAVLVDETSMLHGGGYLEQTIAAQQHVVPSTAPDIEARREAILGALNSLAMAVEEQSAQVFAVETGRLLSLEHAGSRLWAARTLRLFFDNGTVAFPEQHPIFISSLANHLNDQDDAVLAEVVAAFGALNTRVPPEEQAEHMEFTRTVVASAISDAKFRRPAAGVAGDAAAAAGSDAASSEFLLRGFNLPKGLDPLMPLLHFSLINGTPSQREIGARLLADVLQVTSSAALRPYLVKLTGPLIRVLGDRFAAPVKSAVLEALVVLLRKGGLLLRPFVPQLQTSFVKALSDPVKSVRQPAAEALALLVGIGSRADPLVNELSSNVHAAPSLLAALGAPNLQFSTLQAAYLEAMTHVFIAQGDAVSAPILDVATRAAFVTLAGEDASACEAAVSALIAICSCSNAGPQLVAATLGEIMDHCNSERGREWGLQQLDLAGAARALKRPALVAKLLQAGEPALDRVLHAARRDISSPRPKVCLAAFACLRRLLASAAALDASVGTRLLLSHGGSSGTMLEFVAGAATNPASSAALRVQALRGVKAIAKRAPAVAHLGEVRPVLVQALLGVGRAQLSPAVQTLVERAAWYLVRGSSDVASISSSPEELRALRDLAKRGGRALRARG
jgi:hypothetical protein